MPSKKPPETNHEAWLKTALEFIQSKGLDEDFVDFSGGFRCPYVVIRMQDGGPGTNTGHGHVWARPDGLKARCGGRRLCAACARDYDEWGGEVAKSAYEEWEKSQQR
jgi:hypothetical protein